MKKGLLSLCLALGILPLAACGKKDTAVTTATKMDKVHVFKQADTKDLMEQFEMKDISAMVVEGDRLYVWGNYYTEDWSYYDGYRFGSIKLDGTDLKTFSLKPAVEEELSEVNEGIATEPEAGSGNLEIMPRTESTIDVEVGFPEIDESFGVDSDYGMGDYNYTNTYYSNMNVLNEQYILVKNETKEETIEGEYSYSENCYLVALDLDGNEQRSAKLEAKDGEYFYAGNMAVTDDGLIYIQNGENLFLVYNSDFEQVGEVSVPDVYISSMTASKNRIIFTAYNQDYTSMSAYVIENGSLSPESYAVPGVGNFGTIFAGNDTTDLFFATNTEIYGWNLGDAEAVEIIDFIDSDVAISYVEKLCSISDDEFYVAYSNAYDWSRTVTKLSKVAPEDVKEKKVLQLACYYMNSEMQSRVIDFNKNSDEYRIQITCYSNYNTSENYRLGITKLNNDIAQGIIPDVFVLETDMPIDSYAKKGLFADLNKMMEKETEISFEDLAPNVVKAGSYGEQWNILIPSYSISTMVAKESLVGGKANWTFEDAIALMEQYPDAEFAPEYVRDQILYYGMNAMGSSFIDWKTGTCSFNQENFIKLLEFANRFPDSMDYSDEEYWNEYWNQYETMYRDNRALVKNHYLSNLRDLNYTEQGEFGEKITFVGFPTQTGTGSYLNPDMRLAISSKSPYQEGAWEFIKMFLEDDYQLGDQLYALPISLKALDQKLDELTQKPYYTDENGQKVEYDDNYWLNGVEVPIKPADQSRLAEIREFVLSVENTCFYNEDIQTLIYEEAASYFSGQKSAKEVADIIQSRAQIYVNEQM